MGALEVCLPVTGAQRDQGLVRTQVTGALSLLQLIQFTLEGKDGVLSRSESPAQLAGAMLKFPPPFLISRPSSGSRT